MKVKRHKHAKRVLSFFKQHFGLREPYQVIVDGTFSNAALQGKIQIKEQLPKYFGGSVQLVTTRCVVAELNSLKLVGASHVARRFQQRKCGHTERSASAAECILALIGGDNPHHYFVASQDSELKKKLKKIPGVPLLHIVRNTLVLENPSGISEKKAEEMAVAKVNPSAYQKSVIDALGKKTAEQGQRRRRKKAKGPNPLSVRKSHKFPSSVGIPAGVVSKSKKRRARLERRKAVEQLLLAKVVQSAID